MGDIGSRGRGKGRMGRGGWTQDPEGRQGWGRRSRGEDQERRRGDEKCDGGGNKYDDGNDENGGTRMWATEREWKGTGKNPGKQ